jgi:hypothetical protein
LVGQFVQLVDDPVLDSVGARVAVGDGVGARVGGGVGAPVGDRVGAYVGAAEHGRTQLSLPLLGTKPVGHLQHTGVPFGP